MEPIFLIIKHDFDNLENNSAQAHIKQIIGYVESEEQAKVEIEILEIKPHYSFRGWDGNMYPYWTIEKIEHA